mmetsp:Transcript_1152/g.1608  ORF Transcript_1152/g.1608 Transcript_1152/m.1608 type:complete len:194 (-) Transcript_1152:182-763(-)
MELLLTQYKERLEEETKTLVNLGVPPEATEGILLRRMQEGHKFCPPSEAEISKLMVKCRMRKHEASRALSLHRQLKRIKEKTRVSNEDAIKTLIKLLSTPCATEEDDIHLSHSLENKNGKRDNAVKAGSRKPSSLSSKLCSQIISRANQRSSSPKRKYGCKSSGNQPAPRKRNIAVSGSAIKFNILRRKKQKK